jgi:hypothetical protein
VPSIASSAWFLTLSQSTHTIQEIHLPPLGTAEELARFIKTFKELAKMEGNTIVQELLELPNRPSLSGTPAGSPPFPQSDAGVCAPTAFLAASHMRHHSRTYHGARHTWSEKHLHVNIRLWAGGGACA